MRHKFRWRDPTPEKTINKKEPRKAYNDPTADKAIANVMKKNKSHIKRVYICSPLRGNPEIAITACQKAIREECLPLAPYLYFPRFLNDSIPQQREISIMFGVTWLEECDEMWVVGDKVTEVMEREIWHARNRGIPIRRVS